VGITHWDEHQPIRRERGHLGASWTNLGTPAGSYRAGVHRIQMAPGEQPTPAHVHGEAEEIVYVLDGSGLVYMGIEDDEKTYEIRRGDCIVFKNFHEAHTLRGGDDGLEVLAFGGREYLPSGELPRAGVMWSITGYIDVRRDGHPWDHEPPIEWPEPEAERAPTIVNVADVEPKLHGGRRRRHPASAAGSRWTGLTHIELDPGVLSSPPHCHSAEEEIFVVLDGTGTLELTPTFGGGEPEEHPVRRGTVVARPPGTRVAHTFRAGDGGLELIAWGTRDPNDVCWYPRSRKIFWRGVGVIGRIETLDYWDGEELD
jgi:uncharacterized cupin superfamily protein